MCVRFSPALLAVLTLSLVANHARAEADITAAEAVLKAEGLQKVGPLYLLPKESELLKLTASLRKAQATLGRAGAESDSAEKKVNRVKLYIADKELEARKIYDELAKGGLTVERNNQLVGKLKGIEADIKNVQEGPLKKYQDAFTEANEAYIKIRQEYIDSTLAADALADELLAQYEKLSKDPAITAAIEQITKATEKKVALGPSINFKGNANVAKNARKTLDDETIPVTVENNVSMVEVMLNGKVRRSMIVDTGAGLVSIPWDLAQNLGLVPSEDTQKIRLQLADGKIVEAWLMSLKSVQVGPFTVEDVECAVLPESLVAAEPLLGGTFLKNFVVKLDQDRAKLELTRVKK